MCLSIGQVNCVCYPFTKPHYVKTKFCLVPSCGEYKQICIENVNKQTQNSSIIKCYCHLHMEVPHLSHLLIGDLKEAVNFYNANLDTFNSSQFSCNRAYKYSLSLANFRFSSVTHTSQIKYGGCCAPVNMHTCNYCETDFCSTDLSRY